MQTFLFKDILASQHLPSCEIFFFNIMKSLFNNFYIIINIIYFYNTVI